MSRLHRIAAAAFSALAVSAAPLFESGIAVPSPLPVTHFDTWAECLTRELGGRGGRYSLVGSTPDRAAFLTLWRGTRSSPIAQLKLSISSSQEQDGVVLRIIAPGTLSASIDAAWRVCR